MSAEAKPFGYWHQGDTDEESDFFLASESGNVGCAKCVTLYTGAELDRLRAEMAGVREAINAHNADCINQCEQRKQMGKTHCPMKGYDRECGDCPRDGMLDLDAARTPKEPGCDLQAGTVGGGAT